MKKRWIIVPACALVVAAASLYALDRAAVVPRQLAPYVQKRASGHNARTVRIGERIAEELIARDRAPAPATTLPAWRLGVQEDTPAATPAGTVVAVDNVASALRAIREARIGDVVTFAPGHYRFERMTYIETSRAPGVTVRAARPGTVFLEFAMSEGFFVNAARWTFENLDITGVCKTHASCEHAFHVVGGATGFVARNVRTTDFNAHYKVNGSGGVFPDQGRIEQSTLSNASVRATDNPVTMIDVVGASNWVVRANVIADFVKGEGDGISYGAFFKGAGERNRFEANAVLCEHRLYGARGARVGLSLGGGGTGEPYCRNGHCASEQEGSAIEANLVMSCSDEGIYLNRAAHSQVRHNTLVDTAGLMARFAATSAHIEGNIVDGRIAAQQDADLTLVDNLDSGTARVYAGSHPQRALFAAPARLDFSWSGAAPRRQAGSAPDLCGATRPAQAAYGAFEDFAACLKR